MVSQERNMRAVTPVIFILLITISQRSAADGPAVGGQFQVNTYTSDYQRAASVAMDSDGDFVVVWFSFESGGSDSYLSVQGRRYASDGTAVGDDFQVNTDTTERQLFPSVAMDSDGDFVVVWYSNGSSGPDSYVSIQGQRYASDGTAAGGEFQVNTYTTFDQTFPWVASEPDGDFVVVWQSDGSGGSDTSFSSIQGQRYASDGTAVGGEFQVNTYTTDDQARPSVAMDADGDFVVVWISDNMSFSGFSAKGQRYLSDGTAAGGEFQVNTYTTVNYVRPRVALDADGDFVVVWSSDGSSGSDTSSHSVLGQRYASDGPAAGVEFQVNTYTTSYQGHPSVAMHPDGHFVVVWDSDGSSGSDPIFSVQGQCYASDGTALSSEFQVNTYTTDAQGGAAVALAADGDFVVVWSSDGSGGSDSSGDSIQGQRFTLGIFADGFESGDTSAWSSSVP